MHSTPPASRPISLLAALLAIAALPACTAAASAAEAARPAVAARRGESAAARFGTAPDASGGAAAGWTFVSITNGIYDAGTAPPAHDADLCGFFRCFWDDGGLLVECVARDDDVCVDACKPGDLSCRSWTDDCTEIFLDGALARLPDSRADGGVHLAHGGEFVLTANGAAMSDYSSARRGYLPPAAAFAPVAAPRTNAWWTGEAFWSGDAKSGGYATRFYLPWAAMALASVPARVGFTISFQDDDRGGERDHTLYWTGSPDLPFRNESAFGDIVFEGAELPAAFAAPFTSRAVLQRDCPLPVWGTAAPGAEVEVALDARTERAAAGPDGRWRVVFPPQTEPGAGHTLVLRAEGTTAAALDDIAIGDVWLCSGQSNMDMNYGWGLTRGREDMETADDPLMRLFDDRNAASLAPLADLSRPAEWTASDFAHAKGFSACGWFFGQALRKAMPEVPIGLIEASWSGSPIKTWLSREAYCGIDAGCEAAYRSAVANVADYEARGGKAEFDRRFALWTEECATRGDIHAEAPDCDDAGWREVALPGSFESQFGAGFDGCVWYRRAFDLSAAQAAAPDAVLALGPIDDDDETWVNGVPVGATKGWTAERRYKVPSGVLREGRNVVAIRARDYSGGGGLWGRPEALALSFGASGLAPVPLAGTWRASAFAFDPRPVSGEVDCRIPTACYNAMLHPLFPLALKGAIWYQGCTDVNMAPRYASYFRAMAADWRAHFTHPDGLPIYLVQLAAYLDTHDEPLDSRWAAMRWVQMRLGETVERCGTAVAIDVGDHGNIHPKDKKTVGERLARLALVRTYGRTDLVEAGPVPLRAERRGGCVAVAFKNAAGLATSDGGPVRGFQLVDGAGKAVWAEARTEGEAVLVSVPPGFEAARVRHAWDDYPVCNLVNGAALPCGPFELDIAGGNGREEPLP